jgi:hypothetical protein
VDTDAVTPDQLPAPSSHLRPDLASGEPGGIELRSRDNSRLLGGDTFHPALAHSSSRRRVQVGGVHENTVVGDEAFVPATQSYL